MEAGLPTDAERRHDTLLFFSFYIAAITDPEYTNKAAQQTLDWTFPFAKEAVKRGVDNGETHPASTPRAKHSS